MKLTKLDLMIIKEWLFDYADCLFELAGWCGDKESEKELRSDARCVIAMRQKIEEKLRRDEIQIPKRRKRRQDS
jgi:hypothetical protein